MKRAWQLWLSQGHCTPDVQYLLSREAALRPHLRIVALLKGNTIWCSSFTGRGPIALRGGSISTATLTLYPGDQLAPGIPLLAGGYVAVSISDTHLRDALIPVQETSPLTLIVGDRYLTHQGEVRTLQLSSFWELQLRASRYPFSIGYHLPPFISLERLFHQGGMLVMAAILALAAGCYLARYTTPAENLKKALERGEIIPYYQPLVNGVTGTIEGVEVLARWRHPRAGFIPPDAFIPVAGKNGLIIPLTQYLMPRVQTDLLSVIHYLPDRLHIGINISAFHVK